MVRKIQDFEFNTVHPGIAFTICGCHLRKTAANAWSWYQKWLWTGLFRCILAPENSCSISVMCSVVRAHCAALRKFSILPFSSVSGILDHWRTHRLTSTANVRFRLTIARIRKWRDENGPKYSLWIKQQVCVGIKTSKQKVKEKVGQVAETERLP